MNTRVKIMLLLVAVSIVLAFLLKERNSFSRLPSKDVLLQKNKNDCGVASAKNIMVAFNKNPMVIDTMLNAGNDGVTLLEIKNALAQCGLTAKGYKTNLNELTTLGLPAIAHINENHFVVLETIESESVVLIDPSIGRLKYQASAFEKKWDGIVLCVSEKP